MKTWHNLKITPNKGTKEENNYLAYKSAQQEQENGIDAGWDITEKQSLACSTTQAAIVLLFSVAKQPDSKSFSIIHRKHV